MGNWIVNTLTSLPRAVSNALPERARVPVGAAMAAELAFDGVVKHYGERPALDGLSLTVDPGEVVCLLGPSGCGKTTLLRIAAGIERPDAGRVLINGLEVAGPDRFVQPEARGVGLMFQDFALFPHLTILDNVMFGLKALPRENARQDALRMLARVGLERHGDQYPHVLSGGQQQRVALARAMAPRPAVMLMDEPFSGLDVQLRDSMQRETLGLLRETRATTMIVTHHPEEAMALGDRIAAMRAGRLVQVGKAEDLYHRPQDLFVARLFSEINEVEGTVQEGAVATPFGAVAAPGLADGARVTLGIRERGVLLSESGSGGSREGDLVGRVRDARFLGDALRLEVIIEGFEAPLNLRTRIGTGAGEGAEVRVHIDPAEVLVFPHCRDKAA